VYHGPGQKGWEEVPDPTIVDGIDAVVRVEATAICATDLHILKRDLMPIAIARENSSASNSGRWKATLMTKMEIVSAAATRTRSFENPRSPVWKAVSAWRSASPTAILPNEVEERWPPRPRDRRLRMHTAETWEQAVTLLVAACRWSWCYSAQRCRWTKGSRAQFRPNPQVLPA
jgi:hypothetical protein